MKTNFLALCFIIICLTTNTSFAQDNSDKIAKTEQSKSTEIIIGIDGMACQEGCADKIASNLMATKGVISADVNFESTIGLIFFDPALISIEDLKSVITSTKVKDYEYTINSVTIKKK